MSQLSRRRLWRAGAATSTVALLASGIALSAIPSASAHRVITGADCLRAVAPGPADSARQRVFEAASSTYGVPLAVLQGVSYLESQWDNHGTSPSTAGGYGPMNLTDVTVPNAGLAKGDGTVIHSHGPASLHTARAAADMTGLALSRVESDPAANICGGAAVLSSYQQKLDKPTGANTAIGSWYATIRQYAGDPTAIDNARFANEVLAKIKSGLQRTTNDGQHVVLQAVPGVAIPPLPTQPNDSGDIDCPASLGCEWIPAPYEWYGYPDPTAYGNHDINNRPSDMKIDYIVIHDTEGSWDTALQLVQDPTYLGWNYTIRSSDGQVAQHMHAQDVGWHAGNWYVNMHSIGIEHEGYAAQGSTWFTEAMYESSAALVKYLANEYDIPLDRAHIIGHDQVPGILPAYVQGMHWDPGPFWNWQHYMALLGAPITNGTNKGVPQVGDVVTVAPGFANNQQTVTGCDGVTGDPCPPQGTNFVYLHTEPSFDSPLVKDIGLHPDGSYSTTEVWDIGARVDAGQKFVVAATAGKWVGIWYLGELGWMYAPKHNSPIVRSHGRVVTAAAGQDSAPVYGRAYPEASAYPADIPYQDVEPLQYTIGQGQAYVLADATVPTDYYYAKTYNCAYVADDCTDVVGQDTYYEIWFGHRLAYVRAADVALSSR